MGACCRSCAHFEPAQAEMRRPTLSLDEALAVLKDNPRVNHHAPRGFVELVQHFLTCAVQDLAALQMPAPYCRKLSAGLLPQFATALCQKLAKFCRPATSHHRDPQSSLRALHPTGNPVPSTPNPPRGQFHFSAGEVEAAIQFFFPNGSSAGPSGLRPCHLMEMARGEGLLLSLLLLLSLR